MTTQEQSNTGLLLPGLDGANPLAFLAALGVVSAVKGMFPEVRLGWRQTNHGWRPSMQGCTEDKDRFSEQLNEALQSASMTVFGTDKKMPFAVEKFSNALLDAQTRSSIANRRDADFLAGFGVESYPDKKANIFQDSHLRMVRSGDSSGQGLPFYAQAIRQATTLNHIQRALFHPWDYRDKDVTYSLRWDPQEDQRYALRADDPSKSKGGSMLAANALAIEALRCFPVFSVGGKARTTGFQVSAKGEIYFVWPIWTPMVGADTIQSLLTLPDFGTDPLPRSSLARMGVEEVYRSQRIRPNQYYANFSPSVPA